MNLYFIGAVNTKTKEVKLCKVSFVYPYTRVSASPCYEDDVPYCTFKKINAIDILEKLQSRSQVLTYGYCLLTLNEVKEMS